MSMYDDVFLNLPQILEFFNPESYLDIGANKGQNIEFICQQLPNLKDVEMIEATFSHKKDLEEVSNRTGFPYHIEVLSDSVKKVIFYLDPDNYTSPGNSYFAEDNTIHHKFLAEERITNTLDIMYPNKSFDLIKLDTQGSELDIIKGGQKLISRAKGLIIEENVVPYNIGAPLSKDIREYLGIPRNGVSSGWMGSNQPTAQEIKEAKEVETKQAIEVKQTVEVKKEPVINPGDVKVETIKNVKVTKVK